MKIACKIFQIQNTNIRRYEFYVGVVHVAFSVHLKFSDVKNSNKFTKLLKQILVSTFRFTVERAIKKNTS